MNEKIAQVAEIVRAHAPLVVAYSGGVDSTCLLALAHRAAGDRVLAVIADSPSLPRAALAEALENARLIGARVEVLATQEFSNEDYLVNPPNRCYFCKTELFTQLDRLASERNYAAIAYGENADDRADLRPGSRAAREFAVIAPLRDSGLTKSDVRAISRDLGLPTHDAPAQPCLSSRIPHGTRVTSEALALVEHGEAFVRKMGFRVFRVRYSAGPPVGARVQISPSEMPAMIGRENELIAGLSSVGFQTIEFDPEGYR